MFPSRLIWINPPPPARKPTMNAASSLRFRHHLRDHFRARFLAVAGRLSHIARTSCGRLNLRISAFVTALVLALLPALPAAAQDSCTGHPSRTRLFVDVEGIRSDEGLIAVTLYPDDSRRFLARHGSFYVGRVPARRGTTRVCIYVPAPGTYAVAAYHDANSSRRFDRTGIGLPAEAYGFSGNPPTFLGMPNFRSVRLNVARDGAGTRIRLRYP
jgi:uncharacterized protein (DUF2141 family)